MLSRSDANRPTLKNTLKLTGACWLSAAAHMAYRAQVRCPPPSWGFAELSPAAAKVWQLNVL